MGRPPKAPIYVLAHGIEVVGEYAGRRYVMCRVRPHPLLDAAEQGGALLVRRSRVVMTAELGRKLLPSEHVHHRNEDKSDDRPENLELIGAAEHNAHHKSGTRHSEATKAQIGESLRAAYGDGRHRLAIIARDELGRIKDSA